MKHKIRQVGVLQGHRTQEQRFFFGPNPQGHPAVIFNRYSRHSSNPSMYTFKLYIWDRQESTFCVRLITYMIDLHADGRRFLEPSFLCRSSVRQALDVEDGMTDLRYPIGKFHFAGPLTEDQKQTCLTNISETPANLRAAVTGLSEQQLDTPYRPGGWTIRQVVHHVPDSHLNAYVRFKLALTEEEPTIKPYAEDRWAVLADTRTTPIEVSLMLLESLHTRWMRLLGSLAAADWKRTFRHPDLGVMNLERTLALYAWHGRHHVAHITSLRERSGW